MKTLTIGAAALAMLALASGCAGAGWDPDHPKSAKTSSAQEASSADTLAKFRAKAPELHRYFDNAYGVAIFPRVGKGAAGLGMGYGKGEVYEQNQLVGSASLIHVSAGLQLGGQAYSEIIFFEDRAALDTLKAGNFEFGAQASAVAVTAGVSADASYDDGVAVFTMTKGGLMYEAAVAGQKFNYRAL
jgi:lipid-binding SYLF domain-containing protein